MSELEQVGFRYVKLLDGEVYIKEYGTFDLVFRDNNSQERLLSIKTEDEDGVVQEIYIRSKVDIDWLVRLLNILDEN